MAGAVVFDMDGVLVDSEPLWRRVRRNLVTDLGGTWTAEADARVLGMNTREWSSYLSVELGLPMPPDEVASVVIERMRVAYQESVPVISGAPAAVRRLYDAGLPLGLASSSPRALIETVVVALDLADAFGVLVSSDEVARGKPAPDVYLAATADLQHSPADCAAVEDSPNGVRAAAAAGLAVVAIPNPPDAVVPTLPGVLALRGIDEVTPELVRGLSPPC